MDSMEISAEQNCEKSQKYAVQHVLLTQKDTAPWSMKITSTQT